ncbi:MAG TPA: hypothetical protein VH394_06275, partial [Thermoanaerobaculia bacterium]|nr:hypothetical protein [Thermoanaerobaculia bacterium]
MSGPVLDALLRASLQGALFVGAVWIVCRLLPDLPAKVRCALWWLACLKIVAGLASPVELPWLPAESVVVVASEPSPPGPLSRSAQPSLPGRGGDLHSSSEGWGRPSPGEGVLGWSGRGGGGEGLLAALWLTGFLAHLVLTARQLVHARG